MPFSDAADRARAQDWQIDRNDPQVDADLRAMARPGGCLVPLVSVAVFVLWLLGGLK